MRSVESVGMAKPRLITGPARLVRAILRSPAAVASVLPTALDRDFEQQSPIPLLPDQFVEVIGGFPLLLPAKSLLLPGNQPWGGLAQIVGLAKAIHASTVFEIGTYNGVTALTLAQNLPTATVHTLDLPPATPPTLSVSESDPGNYSRFSRRAYEGLPEIARIVQHLGDSATFDFSAQHGACQLVYIDGAHSFDYVANDTQVAFELLGSTGVIVWDDYWRRVRDVARFLDASELDHLFRLPESRLVCWLSGGAIETMSAGRRD